MTHPKYPAGTQVFHTPDTPRKQNIFWWFANRQAEEFARWLQLFGLW